MRWSSGTRGLVVFLGLFVASCGSGGSDEDVLVLAFQGFSGEDIEQADAVNASSADVDVCQSLCVGEDSIEGEPFTNTRINALFVNRGKADIVLDTYTVSVPGSGTAPVTRDITARIPGGRCDTNAQQQCAFDDECDGLCVRQVTSVEILLFDFNFKALVVDGQCPTLDDPLGSVIPQDRGVDLTFSGEDETEDRRTISASYRAEFADFNNCDASQ
jgi:hypothetical protein